LKKTQRKRKNRILKEKSIAEEMEIALENQFKKDA
jgi:hypothetical protein